MDNKPFDGKGYNQGDLSPEEKAQIRHFYSEVQESWPSLENIVTVAKAFVILYNLTRVGGPILLLAAGTGAFLKAQGAF